MLVLTRDLYEPIIIVTPTGDKIAVQPCGARGNQYRIGVTAPEEYKIYRAEKIPQTSQTASQG